jgi:hypothetical protein
MEKLKSEESKIRGYIKDGGDSPAFEAALKGNLTKQSNLKAKIAKELADKQAAERRVEAARLAAKKKAAKQAAILKAKKARAAKAAKAARAKRKKLTPSLYSVDGSLPVQEQFDIVSNELEKEQSRLRLLEDSIDQGVDTTYLTKPIHNLKKKIVVIEEVKSNVERKLASVPADQKVKIEVGAMLDFYYTSNGNEKDSGTDDTRNTYNKKHNDFSMNLFEVNFKGSAGPVSFYADLDFGDFARVNSTESNNENVGQAFLTYETANGYTFNAGKMYTNVGYEVAKAQENWNYTRSHAFSWGGPFWHEGVSLTKSYKSGFGWGAFLYDSWDKTTENNDAKTVSAQLSYSGSKFGIIFNHITGKENDRGTTDEDELKTVNELNFQVDFTDSMSAAGNVVLGTNAVDTGDDGTWTAYVGYFRYVANKWAFTSRVETMEFTEGEVPKDELGGTIAEDSLTFTGLTFTAGYAINDASEFRFEARQDSTDTDYYAKDGELTSSQTTLSFAWLMTL